MSVSSVAPTPFYQDPERLQVGLPQDSSADSTKSGQKHLSMFADGDDSPSFFDLLDVINPLQHIPVVGNIYREMTGDQVGVGARLAGGTLFGGVIGLVASAIDCMVEESSGEDVGGHVLALFRDEGSSAPTTQLAQAQAQPAAPLTATPTAKPAETTAKAVADAAPVINLPGGAADAPQAMVFSLDAMQAADSAAPAQLASAAPVAAAPIALTPDAAPAAAPAAKALSLGGNGRALHMPQRAAKDGTQSLPPVNVPVSNSSARSNVPITGRSPQSNAVSAATAQRAQASQDSLANHPMAPPTDASGQVTASPDWFTAAWGQALDKYQRANQRNDKTTTSATTTTVE